MSNKFLAVLVMGLLLAPCVFAEQGRGNTRRVIYEGIDNGGAKALIDAGCVSDSGGNCYEDDMLAAMEDAVVQGIAKVMSISIGGGSYTTSNCDSDPLAAKLNSVVDRGITAVVAAGNDGKGVSTPGCASKAIAVGAVDKTGAVPYFSGRGPALDIVAPGVSIYSTYVNNGYATMSGTSMATPHVSGVVALLLEKEQGTYHGRHKECIVYNIRPDSGML